MKTFIDASYYHDNDIFILEKVNLFENTWQFAGFTDELSNNQDYVCTFIANKTIVLMNFKGKIKAFHNVCSHRQNQICLQNSGNGPLQCQYHGWTYNEEGYPYAIPKRKSFSELNLENLRLTQYQVETIGRFVFLKIRPGPETLSNFLTKTYPILKKISDAMGERIDKNEMLIDANWKVIVENTLEDYHVYMVHQKSFNTLGINERSFENYYPHSSTLLKFDMTLDQNKKVDAAFKNRPIQINDYFHQLIFPNLTFASAYGVTFSLQQIIPLGPTKTKFISHTFSTKINETTPLELNIVKVLNNSAIDFNRRVFEEDKIMCEQVQKGLMEAENKYGVLSNDEQRIYAFQQAYHNYLTRLSLCKEKI